MRAGSPPGTVVCRRAATLMPAGAAEVLWCGPALTVPSHFLERSIVPPPVAAGPRYRSAHPHVQGVVETAYAIDGWRRRASGVIVLGYLAALGAWDAPGDGVTLSALRAPLADWATGAEHNTVIKRPHHCGGLRAG